MICFSQGGLHSLSASSYCCIYNNAFKYVNWYLTSYCCRDTLIVCGSNYIFSFVCTFMVAGFTGYLASTKGVDIAEAATSGMQKFHIFAQNFTIEYCSQT